MKTLRECIADASAQKKCIGHFNFSNLEMLRAIFNAGIAKNMPVIAGVSEGERDFVGIKQAVALVKSLREEHNFPIFLNADHTYSLERAKEAIDAGFDMVVVDGAGLSLQENIKLVKGSIGHASKVGSDTLVEGELGYIGTSSKVVDELPDGVSDDGRFLTKPEEALEFVEATGLEIFSPAVGSFHGVLRSGKNPVLDIKRIAEIKNLVKIPLVLHGGSGQKDTEFVEAAKAGISVVHISTDLRVAYRSALTASLAENPDEIAPYKYLKSPIKAVQEIVEQKIAILAGL